MVPLTGDPLPIDLADAIAAARQAGRLPRLASSVAFFQTIGSTNDAASAMAFSDSPEGTTVIAEAQTAGRGRRGRTWFSPPTGGLYVSVILAPTSGTADPARAMAIVTLMAGVALAEGIEAATGLAADVKWPNDLVVQKRKLAGILAEGVAGAAAGSGGGIHAVVLGYGVNVGPMRLPVDLAARATALDAELGRAVDRALVLAETLVALDRRYRDLLAGRFDAILDAWRRRAPSSRGARVQWQGPAGPVTGITEGIDDRGALLVRTAHALERIASGEVTWT